MTILSLRREQLAAFRRAHRLRFENRLIEHVRRFFPATADALDDEGLRQLCRRAVRRAAWYGMAAEADVARYLSVMLVFGSRFDEDPSLPWARRMLAQDVGSTLKSHRLYLAALEHEPEGRGWTALPQDGGAP